MRKGLNTLEAREEIRRLELELQQAHMRVGRAETEVREQQRIIATFQLHALELQKTIDLLKEMLKGADV